MYKYIHTHTGGALHIFGSRGDGSEARTSKCWSSWEGIIVFSIIFLTLHSKCTRALDFVLFVGMFVGRDWHGSFPCSIFIIIHYDTDLVLFVGMFVGRGWHGRQSG